MENKNMGIIVLLLLIIMGLGGYILYDKIVSKDNDNVESVEKENTKEEVNNSSNEPENNKQNDDNVNQNNNLSQEDIVKSAFVDLYNGIIYNNETVEFIDSNFINNNVKNTNSYNVIGVSYNSCRGWYEVIYSYTCKDNTGNCLYVGQVNEKENEVYKATACVKYENGKITTIGSCAASGPCEN